MSVEKFLKQRAVRIIVNGSYTLPNWYDAQGKLRTFACRTTRVSPFRMIVDVPVVGKIGDRLTSYFEEFGKFEGCITDTVSGDFLLELEMTHARREKFADKLTWIEKKQKDPSVREARNNPRFVPVAPHAMLTLADGTMQSCFIIDMSLSGAAVSSELQPPIGMPLAIGACVGRVVRHLPNGFAIKFVETYKQSELGRLIARKSKELPAVPADAVTGEGFGRCIGSKAARPGHHRQSAGASPREEAGSHDRHSGGTIRLRGLPQFVWTRGGAYTFLPSLSAIRFLGSQMM